MNLETILRDWKRQNQKQQSKPELSAKLGKLQKKADGLSYRLMMEYLRDPDKVIASVERDPTAARLCKMLLLLNHEFSLCKDIKLPEQHAQMLHKQSSLNLNQYNEALHSSFFSQLTERIDNCLELIPKKGQPVNATVLGKDGYRRNSKLRSIFSQLYGLASENGLRFSLLTLDFAEKYCAQPIDTKVLESLKKRVNYRISNAVPDGLFAGAFVFELKKSNLHAHALIIHPAECEKDIAKSLRKLALRSPSSVQLKSTHRRLRAASKYEVLYQTRIERDIPSFEVEDLSALTVGIADYLSKRLLKSLGYGGRASRIITLSNSSFPKESFEDYHKAREELLVYIGNILKAHWSRTDQQRVINQIINEPGLFKDIWDVYTAEPEELTNAA